MQTQRIRRSGKRILLAEDQQGVREAIRFLLSIDEHVVVESRNGTEALDKFNPEEFDLVITDFAMPGMQGDELAASIKRLAPRMPVIMITAYADTLERGALQVDAMLSKPFAMNDLRQAMNKVLPDEPTTHLREGDEEQRP
jgi:CheY-like chemotaxis protein